MSENWNKGMLVPKEKQNQWVEILFKYFITDYYSCSYTTRIISNEVNTTFYRLFSLEAAIYMASTDPVRWMGVLCINASIKMLELGPVCTARIQI